jgi:hypothetical protein
MYYDYQFGIREHNFFTNYMENRLDVNGLQNTKICMLAQPALVVYDPIYQGGINIIYWLLF